MVRRYDNKRVLIAAHMDNMISYPPTSKMSVEKINRVFDVIQESRRALKNLTCPVDHWNAWFVHLAIYQLDQTPREKWGKSLGQSAELPTFARLTTFIETMTEALDTAQASVTHLKKAPSSSGNKESPS